MLWYVVLCPPVLLLLVMYESQWCWNSLHICRITIIQIFFHAMMPSISEIFFYVIKLMSLIYKICIYEIKSNDICYSWLTYISTYVTEYCLDAGANETTITFIQQDRVQNVVYKIWSFCLGLNMIMQLYLAEHYSLNEVSLYILMQNDVIHCVLTPYAIPLSGTPLDNL